MCPVNNEMCVEYNTGVPHTHTYNFNRSQPVIILFAEIKMVFVSARHEFSQLRSLQHHFTIFECAEFHMCNDIFGSLMLLLLLLSAQ